MSVLRMIIKSQVFIAFVVKHLFLWCFLLPGIDKQPGRKFIVRKTSLNRMLEFLHFVYALKIKQNFSFLVRFLASAGSWSHLLECTHLCLTLLCCICNQFTSSGMRPSAPDPVIHLSELPQSTVHSPLILTGPGTSPAR